MEIEISKITVGDRQRFLYEDIDKLAESIKRYGLIQPIVLNQNNELIAGGRRLRAMLKLGWTHAPYCYKETLSAAQQSEMELEENVRRNALTWQETCKAIKAIHDLKSSDAACCGEEWGYAETGELLGKVKSNVWYAVTIGSLLASDEELRKQPTMSDAIKLLVSRKEREAAALLVTEMKSRPINSIITPISLDENNQTTPEEVKTETQLDEQFITSRCISCDSIDTMRHMAPNCIDHIYSDPPYAINMENLTQSGSGQDVSRVLKQHEVLPNTELLLDFLHEAARILKPTGFCVFWCDQDNWAWLKLAAEREGFAVCRWPLVWCKTDICINQMAYMNFTKATEIAMVLRMPEARLVQIRPTNYWTGGNDREDYDTKHPFWKPLTLHMWVIRAISLPGQIIFDPFAGEGSIPLACMQAERDFLAYEIADIHYVQLVKNVTNSLKHVQNNALSV